ncbi:hypothetical protein L7F22_053481 [Adiantum nelumboides]|nr:hypothetical protein [Adiantum nelumboides]
MYSAVAASAQAQHYSELGPLMLAHSNEALINSWTPLDVETLTLDDFNQMRALHAERMRQVRRGYKRGTGRPAARPAMVQVAPGAPIMSTLLGAQLNLQQNQYTAEYAPAAPLNVAQRQLQRHEAAQYHYGAPAPYILNAQQNFQQMIEFNAPASMIETQQLYTAQHYASAPRLIITGQQNLQQIPEFSAAPVIRAHPAPPTASALAAVADGEQHVFSSTGEGITPDQDDPYYYDQELLDLLDGLDCDSTLNIEQNIGSTAMLHCVPTNVCNAPMQCNGSIHYNDAPASASTLGAAADHQEQHVISTGDQGIQPDLQDDPFYDQELLETLDCDNTAAQNVSTAISQHGHPANDCNAQQDPQILDLPINVSGDKFPVMTTDEEEGLAAPHDTLGSNVQARIISQGRCTVSENIMEQDEEMPELKIQSVVCTAQLGCAIDLEHVSSHALNASYDPKRHPAVFMWIRSPKSTAMIYRTGKLACRGTKNDADAKMAARKFARIMQRLGYRVRLSKIKIFCKLASCDVKFPINLSELQAQHKQCIRSYNPAKLGLPGVIMYSMRDLKHTELILFSSGKIFLIALTSQIIEEAFDCIYPVLLQHKD